jgi:hypothetical protein
MSNGTPSKPLKETTQDGPKNDALERKNAVLLQPAPALARPGATFTELLGRSGFGQGIRFKFETDYLGAPVVNISVAEGTGTLVLLTDTMLKLTLAGTISLGDVATFVAKLIGEDVNDPDYLKAQIGVYPGPANSDDERPIRFSQTFEIVTRTQIQLVTQNELPATQLPGGIQDKSTRILDFAFVNQDGKPTLELPRLFDDDKGNRWFMRVSVDEPGLIKQFIGFRKLVNRVPEQEESLQVRTEIEKA